MMSNGSTTPVLKVSGSSSETSMSSSGPFPFAASREPQPIMTTHNKPGCQNQDSDLTGLWTLILCCIISCWKNSMWSQATSSESSSDKYLFSAKSLSKAVANCALPWWYPPKSTSQMIGASNIVKPARTGWGGTFSNATKWYAHRECTGYNPFSPEMGSPKTKGVSSNIKNNAISDIHHL